MFPAQLDRTTLGLAEGVLLKTEPPTNVHWELQGPGILAARDGTASGYLAPTLPGNATITASINGVPCQSVRFTIVEPTGVECHVDREIGCNSSVGPPNNYLGAETWFRCILQPTSVSFDNIAIRENIPAQYWFWPDGSLGFYPSFFSPPFPYINNNEFPDMVSRCRTPIIRIDAPPTDDVYVDFQFDLVVPLEYQRSATEWIPFFTGIHRTEFRATDAQTRISFFSLNYAIGGWQGPWQ